MNKTLISNRNIVNAVLLILSVILIFFTGGDTPLEAAVWLAPVFLLRYIRQAANFFVLLIPLPLIIIVTLFTNKGMQPLPERIFVTMTCIKAVIFLTPYIIYRYVYKYLPTSRTTLLFPALVILTEAFLMSEFSGGTQGNPAYGISNITILQFASLAGPWGIMFLVYWTAAVINRVWDNSFQLRKAARLALVYSGIMIMVWGYGTIRLRNENNFKKVIEVATVTPGENQRDKMYSLIGQVFASKRTGDLNINSMKKTMAATNNYLISETKNVAQTGSGLIAWPEGAAIIFESEEREFYKGLTSLSKQYNTSLAIGIMVIKDSCVNLVKDDYPFVYNKLVYISPNEGVLFEYHKHNHAPGWEKMMTIPVESKLPCAITEKGNISGAICYDMDFPDQIRETAAMNADIIVAPSNDWAEIKNIHSRMARMRAIENGASLLRPTANGISMVTDQYGRILAKVDDLMTSGAPMVAVIPVKAVFTLYPVLGDFVIWLSLILTLLILIWAIYTGLSTKLYSKSNS